MYHYYWFAFAIYFASLFAIGIAVRKKNATSADLLLGSRKLNFWVTALSAQASDMSSWLFMAFPMTLYIGGVPNIWIAIALLLGMFCNWQFLAKKFREQTEYLDCYTLPSYLSKRFEDNTGKIRIISAIICILFLCYYVAAGLISIGFLFESIFDIDYTVGVIVATCAIVGYTFIGGFVSVAWVDLFQAVFLLCAIILVPLLAFTKIDGVQAIIQAAEKGEIPLSFFGTNSIKDIFYPLLGWGLGYFGMPHIITKFMGISDPKDLVKSKYVGMTWQLLALLAAAAVGLIAIAYFHTNVDNPELIFVLMVKELFHPLAAGFVLCGLIAATVSTMDSQVLVASSVVTEDIYKARFAKNCTSKREVVVFRIAVVVVALIAFWISMSQSTTIMDAVYYAWSGLGCSFGPVILFSLYSKRLTKEGALAAICTGAATSALWPT